jgi:hypothetical protein
MHGVSAVVLFGMLQTTTHSITKLAGAIRNMWMRENERKKIT